MSEVHPLDPLTPEEIRKSAEIVRKVTTGRKWIFNSITLEEPPKQLFLEYIHKKGNVGLDRKAFVILIEKNTGRVVECVVNLNKGELDSFKTTRSGNQPTITPEECFSAEKIAKCDEGAIKRCKDMEIMNMDLVVGDPWSVGYNGSDPELDGKRLIQLFMYCREYAGDNHYAHPLSFVPIVDMVSEKVIRIDDLPLGSGYPKGTGKVKIPKDSHNYDQKLLGEAFLRKDVKPLETLSPQGPSFITNGNEIKWQKYTMRISFNYREGLVLHNVTYQDEQLCRPLLYRASLAEMVVPYGDPRPPFHRKCAFDVGDYGLGFCTNSLKLGCDCFGHIKYFDGVLNDHDGEPVIIKNAICLHEEDAGILFKHTEYRTGEATVTRSRKLVLSFIATVVNYEYAIYWTFAQDGTIGFEVKATGELSTNLTDARTSTSHGTLVAKNINAQFHQHIFAVRLDVMIDGSTNTVSMVDVKPLEEDFGSEENPFGQGFKLVETVLKNTEQAKTNVCPETSRFWKIYNEFSTNVVTDDYCSYKLIPLNGAKLLAKPGSYIAKRAGFAAHSVWVTEYEEGQRYPGGFYVNQSKGGDGLPQWTKEIKDTVCKDLVLWHVFGVTHIPRVEDFPIMSVEPCGFILKPYNFFGGNPALDVPSPQSEKKC